MLYNALMAARNKLSVYYGMTGPVKKGGGQGLLFNLGIILNPRDKLQWYNRDSWTDMDKVSMQKEFLDYYAEHYAKTPIARRDVATHSFATSSDIDDATQTDYTALPHGVENEAQAYLNDPIIVGGSTKPLVLWAEIEKRYPTMAQMARDVLCVAAAGVNVERVFNASRDICTYR